MSDRPIDDPVGPKVAPEIIAVLGANQAFYDAHESRDIDAMRAVWEHSDRVVCTHPGWPILRTWPVVEESWRRILGGPGRNQFILTNEAVTIHGDMAWVTLDENLVDAGGTGTVAATNLFVRTASADWLLVVHHGSPVMTS
jgi:SnoaL-like domain